MVVFWGVLFWFFFPVVDTAKASSFADASLVRSSLRALLERLKYWAAISLIFSPVRFFNWIPVLANGAIFLCEIM